MRIAPALAMLLGAAMSVRGIGYLFGKPPANPRLLIGENTVKPGRERLAGLVFLIGTVSSLVFGVYLLLTPDFSYWIVLIMVPFFVILPVAVDIDWSRRRRAPS